MDVRIDAEVPSSRQVSRSPNALCPNLVLAMAPSASDNISLPDNARCSSPTIMFSICQNYSGNSVALAPKRATMIARPAKKLCGTHFQDRLLALELLTSMPPAIFCSDIFSVNDLKRKKCMEPSGFRVEKRLCKDDSTFSHQNQSDSQHNVFEK